MSDLFTRYTTPPPASGLRERVLAAASSAPAEPAPLRVLDLLASSRTWWLGWSAAMVLLVVLGDAPRGDDREPFTAESWRRYRASLAEALGSVEVAGLERDAAGTGGAA